jgi:hypothetical protein
LSKHNRVPARQQECQTNKESFTHELIRCYQFGTITTEIVNSFGQIFKQSADDSFERRVSDDFDSLIGVGGLIGPAGNSAQLPAGTVFDDVECATYALC